jgi:hypothetical protein
LQQLHLVGFTTEHDALIFSARKGAKSGGFLVALDDTLYDTIDEAARLRDGDEDDGGRRGKGKRPATPRPESALSPRDIQMRLRAGRSVSSVATEARVDEEWILRFAAPILAEQAQVVQRAQNMTFAKARLGESGRPLGESVWWNIADKGALMASDTFDQCWSAQHMRDSMWIVRFEFVNRKKRQRAEWEVDTRERTIVGRNRLAAELGYVEPGRRGRPPAPLPPVAKPVPKPTAPAARNTASTARAIPVPARKRPAAKKRPAVKKAAAKKRPPAKKRPTVKKAAAKKTATRRPAPKKRPAPKRAAAKRPATAKRTTAKRTAPAKKRPAAKKAARRPTAKRAPAKRPAAKKQSRPKKTAPTPVPAEHFETPALEPGEPTRPVTIRAALARAPEPEADGPAALEAPAPVLSTPAPVTTRPAPAPRRFGRLRRRRPPGG